jgi:ribonuclease VapC
MFVDASAIIAIIAGEADRLSLSARLAQSSEVYVSPIVVYEAMTGLARLRPSSRRLAQV